MFKKPLIFVCLAAATLFILCGCSINREAALPRLIIGCGDYEPYNYTNADGESAGLDVDLAREACRRMGYEPVFQRIDWNERDAALESGQVDCLWSCLSMDAPEDSYAWVGPYMRSRQVVAVLEGSPLHTLSDLTGKRIAVRAGSMAEKLFLERTEENIPQVGKLYTQSQTDEITTALRNEYVDAIAGFAVTIHRVLQNENMGYRYLDEDLGQDALGIAFSKSSDPELRNALSQALQEMLADGTTEAILECYGAETDKALGGLTHE